MLAGSGTKIGTGVGASGQQNWARGSLMAEAKRQERTLMEEAKKRKRESDRARGKEAKSKSQTGF